MNNKYLQIGALAITVLLCFLSTASRGGNLPNGFTELRLAQGLDGTTVNHAPDGRLFVTQKIGLINIIKNGALLPTPLLDIKLGVDNRNERGLQTLVFDPNFATNGYIYVYYCAIGQNYNRVSRFTVVGDVADHNSELIILNLDVLASDIHNGGAMFFKEGKLFITTGEGSTGSLAQSFTSLLGKVLRINVDGSIPTDNPFYLTLTGKYRLIYALGFRNPFRADIQPGTNRVFVNDVGGSSFEEINELFPGKNYGWPTIEGKRTTQVAPDNYQDPLYAYAHSLGCCIGGGAFYNPPAANFPSKYAGKYFFGDYCGNYIKVLDPATGLVIETFATNINRPISFTIGNDGSFYYLARGGLLGGTRNANTQSCCAEVWRVQFTNNGMPTISAQPEGVTVPVGGSAAFVVGASGDAPLSIQWQRNGVNIQGATSALLELSTTTLADNGAQFRAVITNPLGTITSNSAILNVVNNVAPVATITTPVLGSTYVAGTMLSFSGSATDAEDGTLPPASLSWTITFHHGTHTHPAMDPVSGISSGTYQLGNREPATNVWYRIYLTATDSNGEQTTVSRDVLPVLSSITLTSSNPGLKLNFNGVEFTTPKTFASVAGVIHEITAPTSQSMNDIPYQFQNWSDGGLPQHEIVTPTSSSTLTAFYNSNQQTGYSAIYEGEDAILVGADKRYGQLGFTGTGYADYITNIDSYVEWTVTVPSSGKYKLDFRYGNGTTLDRPLQISVNNTITESRKAFLPTGLWTTWKEVSSIVTLTSGVNTIRASTIGSNGSNIDHLKVSSIALAAPSFTPAGGSYSGPQAVTLTTPEIGSTIYYTLDGSTPTSSSLIYSSPINISTTTTIKAFAKAAGLTDSPVSTSDYTINTTTIATIFEAENANLVGGLVINKKYLGFTGTGYVTYTLTYGQYTEWNVTVPTAGQYVLDFRYANGALRDRPLDINVNGIIVQARKSFPYTGSWSSWSTVSKTVTLLAGNNTIRAISIGSTAGNIDHLKVSNPPAARIINEDDFTVDTGDKISKDVEVYPVPTRDILSIKSRFIIEAVAVETIDGSTFKPTYVRKTDYDWEVNLTQLNGGLYILNVKGGNKVVRKKIIIEK